MRLSGSGSVFRGAFSVRGIAVVALLVPALALGAACGRDARTPAGTADSPSASGAGSSPASSAASPASPGSPIASAPGASPATVLRSVPPVPPERRNAGAGAIALADATRPTFGVAADSTHVYWGHYEGGEIMRVPLRGGSAEVIAEHQDYVNAIASSGTHVYWSIGHGSNPGGTIFRLPKNGGTPEAFAPNQAGAASVTLDTTHVYWIAAGGYDGKGGTDKGGIRRAPIKGGPVESLSTDLPGPTRIVVDDDSVYVVALGAPQTAGNGVVAKLPKQGGPVTILASNQAHPHGLAVDATHVYISIIGPFVMPPSPKCLTKTPCPAATTAPITNQGEVRRVAKSGGKVETLVRDLHYANMVAVNANRVFFSARGLFEVPVTGGPAKSRIPYGSASQMVFRDGMGYAQVGGQIVAIE